MILNYRTLYLIEQCLLTHDQKRLNTPFTLENINLILTWIFLNTTLSQIVSFDTIPLRKEEEEIVLVEEEEDWRRKSKTIEGDE